MDKRFLAIAIGQNGGVNTANNSGWQTTKLEAETWGIDHLGKTPSCAKVVITTALATVERESPPIKVHSLIDDKTGEFKRELPKAGTFSGEKVLKEEHDFI